MRIAADNCAAAAPRDDKSEYFKKCMKQYGYSVASDNDLIHAVARGREYGYAVPSDDDPSARPVQGQEEIQIEERGSSYYVPVRINDTITIPFLLDTGAGDLAIPADIAQTLMRAGALKSGDFIGKRLYQIANGSEEISPVVSIREVRVGDHVARNVTAGITPPNGEPLLGQSFLSKFGTLTVDYKRRVLVLSP
jgi:predicted aspartyl protease